ncbi:MULTISPECIES: SMI1/KNR4 family protein [unclassified Streptomyces]|uniref:SMI1/KNR4 family protein n=1 Tax=unclassified Streptomyces TaxID=2593676 RepID=UPI00278C5FEF|nr:MULTISPECIES: SMI1/KNR4 family protein [unclassified Streptomyces]
MADGVPFDWRRFLGRWSAEWADAQSEARLDADVLSEEDEESMHDRWLGFDPASEERITALERRLGRELPPSYREFLRVSDGWRRAGYFVWRLAGTEHARWHEDEMGLGAEFDMYWADNANPPEVRAQVGLWSRGLQLDVESDAVIVLLDPEDVGPDGEWAVRTWAHWRAEDPDRYPSFADFMVAMHQEFHRFAAERDDADGEDAGREDEDPFVNDTTRAQDAAVDRARTAALRGRHEEAAELLREAAEYGRPGAASMLRQLETVRGGGGGPGVPTLPSDPGYLTDLLPLAAAELVRNRVSDGLPWRHADPEAYPDTAEAAAGILREMREGSYAYRPGGAFGESVNEAREAARWGDTNTAWRLLLDALPSWRPLGPDQLVPLGLLADPLLATVLTPERRLELLATPRGDEQQGPATEPAPEPEPDGLSWVIRPGLRPNQPHDVRFVLVEGAAPDDLPALLGASPDTALAPPLRGWDVPRHHRPGQRSFTSDDDMVLLRVGRAGRPDWSFGLDDDPVASYIAKRFASPAVPASADGRRAIVVWCGRRWDRVTFHLSVAQDGAPLYGFTATSGDVDSRSGAIPAELSPERLGFGSDLDEEAQLAAVVRALDALAGLYGVSLPRLALTAGRLHSFEAAPWIRPPAPGESYASLAFVRHRNGGSAKGNASGSPR